MDAASGTGHDGGPRPPLRDRLRLAFLTARGWALLVAGVAALLVAWFLGRRELLNVSIFLLAVPLLAAAAVGLGRTRLHVRRGFTPDPVVAGSPTEVVLHLHHSTPLPAGTVLDEQLPTDFGSNPSFASDDPADPDHPDDSRDGDGSTTTYRYRLRPTHRGVYPVGPLRARLTDPFGLAVRPIAVDRASPLTVVPPVVVLPATGVLGSTGTRGTATAHHQATPENDDVMTREYRDGDSLRRVHWPATARHQTLMVRQEQFQRTPRATFVVDTRPGPFQGSYLGFDAPTEIPNFLGPAGATTGCFDWVITAVVSMGAHLAGQGYELDVLDETGGPLAGTGAGTPGAPAGRFAGPDTALDLQLTLAPVGLKPATTHPVPVDDAPPATGFGTGNGPLLLFTGGLDADQAAAWVHRIGTHRNVVAFVVASRPAATLVATRAFRSSGWAALPTDPGTPLPETWLELAAQERRTGPRGRS